MQKVEAICLPVTVPPIPEVCDIVVRCLECRKLQARSAAHDGAIAFTAQCLRCGEPPPGMPTTFTVLVPVGVRRSPDNRTWLVRELTPDEVVEEREAGSVGAAECVACGEFQDEFVWFPLDGVGPPDELHYTAGCAFCEAPTALLVTCPAIISRSHEDDEWYLVVLRDDEIELARHGVDFDDDNWSS